MSKDKDEPVVVFACGPSRPKCRCSCTTTGECEHQWDGPEEIEEYAGGSVSVSSTCSRCGMTAISHSMWVDW